METGDGKKDSSQILSGIIAAIVVFLSQFLVAKGLLEQAPRGSTAHEAETPAAEEEKAPEVTDEDIDAMMKAPNAEIVVGKIGSKNKIFEFFDYNCGYCHKFHEEVRKMVKDKVDAEIHLKHLPIFGGLPSKVAASAVYAAKMQGKGNEMHTMIFEKGSRPAEFTQAEKAKYEIAKMPNSQEEFDALSENDRQEFIQKQKALGEEMARRTKVIFQGYAAELKLDVKKFKEDMDSADFEKDLQANLAIAEKFKIRGTPAIFINKKLIPGYMPAESVKREL